MVFVIGIFIICSWLSNFIPSGLPFDEDNAILLGGFALGPTVQSSLCLTAFFFIPNLHFQIHQICISISWMGSMFTCYVVLASFAWSVFLPWYCKQCCSKLHLISLLDEFSWVKIGCSWSLCFHSDTVTVAICFRLSSNFCKKQIQWSKLIGLCLCVFTLML